MKITATFQLVRGTGPRQSNVSVVEALDAKVASIKFIFARDEHHDEETGYIVERVTCTEVD